MARKVEIKESEEIRHSIEAGKSVIGTDVTLKELKRGNLVKVFLSSNVQAEVKNEMNHYASIVETEVVELELSNEELGIVCKKPFAVSIFGIKK